MLPTTMRSSLPSLLRSAEVTGGALPVRAIAPALDHLVAGFPDGAIRRQRLSYAGVGTWAVEPSGGWARRSQAFRFPLLEATSALGEPCPYLTRQWSATRRAVIGLLDGHRIAADV